MRRGVLARSGSRSARTRRRSGIARDLPSPVIEVSRDGRLRFANPAAAELFGLKSAPRGCQLLDLIGATESDRERLRRRLAPLLARRMASVRVWLEPSASTARPLVWRVARRRDTRDRTLGFVVLAELRAAAHHLAQRAALFEQRLADFAAATPDWLWETDAQHRFTYVSQRMEVLTGIARSCLLGQMRTELMTATLPPDAVAQHAAELAAHHGPSTAVSRPFSLPCPTQTPAPPIARNSCLHSREPGAPSAREIRRETCPSSYASPYRPLLTGKGPGKPRAVQCATSAFNA